MRAEIWRDEHGVPHIRATARHELYWGQGVVHATDRGLQMLLMRILVQGRLSEQLSATDGSLRLDRFFRRMHWHDLGAPGDEPNTAKPSERPAHEPDSDEAYLQAYCDGANSVFDRRIPWELKLLGYRHQPWQIADMVAISRMIGYLALQQSQADLERLLLEMIQAGIEPAALEELFPGQFDDADFALLRQVRLSDRIVPDDLPWCSAAPRMMSSNNWVVAGSKTASGKPLLCNDPHLEGNRLPNVWSEVVLQIGNRYLAGGSMPGAPGIMVGRNNDVAWGATYSFADAVDSWIERCRDGMYYREPDGWLPFRQRRETILRKRKPSVDVVFYENDHGVLDGDPHQENVYLTTRWASANAGVKTLGLLLQMWDARDLHQTMHLLGQIETPWNFVIADRQGNIGYQMSGLIPRRRKAQHGLVPLPGWQAENDWSGFEPSERLPRAVNPACGFLVTANNDLNALGQVQPIKVPMGPYRADRIADQLRRREAWTPADMQALQFDLYSTQAARFMEHLEPVLPPTPQGDLLRNWDRSYTADSLGASLFEAFYKALLREVFGSEAWGTSVFDHLWDQTGIFVDFHWNFDRILLAENSIWFRGRHRQELYRAVAEKALSVKPVPWGRQHKYALTHLLLGGRLPRFLGFDRGPITAIGGRATVHQGQIHRSNGRVTTFVPSLRLVTDMADDCLWSTLLGGPSDRRFSRWYASEVNDWLRGNYKRLGPADGTQRHGFP